MFLIEYPYPLINLFLGCFLYLLYEKRMIFLASLTIGMGSTNYVYILFLSKICLLKPPLLKIPLLKIPIIENSELSPNTKHTNAIT